MKRKTVAIVTDGSAVLGFGKIGPEAALPVMEGALKARAKSITDEIKIIACKTLAELVSESDLNEEFIFPDIFDFRVVDALADAVFKAVKKG